MARSLEYRVERLSAGSVVYPTWLFVIRCSVPPVAYPSSDWRLRVSATTPWPGKRSVAVDQHGQRDRRVVDARARRAVGLLGARATFDDGVCRLEMTRVRNDRHVDLTGLGDARSRCGKVVLDVTCAALGVDDERVDRSFALELAQDRLIRPADRVDERVEPSPMGHPDHDLVRTAGRSEGDRLVEHRHERLEPLERELLLPEERAAQVLLEPFGLGETMKERSSFLGGERLPEAP